jgi:hypothetical protein
MKAKWEKHASLRSKSIDDEVEQSTEKRHGQECSVLWQFEHEQIGISRPTDLCQSALERLEKPNRTFAELARLFCTRGYRKLFGGLYHRKVYCVMESLTSAMESQSECNGKLSSCNGKSHSVQWKVDHYNQCNGKLTITADKIVSSGQGVFGGGLYIGSEW